MLGISTMCTAGPRTAPCKGLQAIFLEETPSELKAWELFSKHGLPLGLCNFYTWICPAKLHDSCICRQCSAVSHSTRGWLHSRSLGDRHHATTDAVDFIWCAVRRSSTEGSCGNQLETDAGEYCMQLRKRRLIVSGLWLWYTMTTNRSAVAAMTFHTFIFKCVAVW